MYLVKVAETIITEVMITPKGLPESQKIFENIISQNKELARSLSYLNLSESTVSEACFIVTVFIDEVMFIKYQSWPLQQIVNFQTNKGGEEFYNKLDLTLERYEKEGSAEDLALIELYDFLLSLNFTGKYWNDPEEKLLDYRRKMNGYLQIGRQLNLVNAVAKVPKASKITSVNLITLTLIIIICLITVFVSFMFDDFSTQQGDMWRAITDKYTNGVER